VTGLETAIGEIPILFYSNELMKSKPPFGILNLEINYGVSTITFLLRNSSQESFICFKRYSTRILIKP
jgi:hypothetical protein